MRVRLRTVVIVVILLLFLVVVAQNVETVSVKLLLWDFVMSRIVLLVLSLAVGIVLGVLLGRPWNRRSRRDRSEGSKQEYARIPDDD